MVVKPNPVVDVPHPQVALKPVVATSNVVLSDRTSGVVELPSRGKFYGDICSDGLVELFAMTGRDEALLAGMGDDESESLYDVLLKRCLKAPAIDLAEMLVTDKFYLMLVLRSNSYGSHYEYKVPCPRCNFPVPGACEIPDDFKITEYEEKMGTEPFQITLPKTKKVITFRLLRSKDEAVISSFRKQQLGKTGGEKNLKVTMYLYRMAKHLLTVDGKEFGNIGEAMNFYENLPAMDSSEIKTAIDDVTTGVEIDLQNRCPSCETKFRTDLPFDSNFFRTHRRTVGKS